jgi:adenosylhomocysteinase
MDMSFANQFLALCRLAKAGKGGLSNEVFELPPEQDQDLARIKLGTMGVKIDALTEEQKRYNEDYSAGT